MNPVLTITIESGDYINLDFALRIKTADYHPDPPPYVPNIIRARQALGLSMKPQHLFSDYVDDLLPIQP